MEITSDSQQAKPTQSGNALRPRFNWRALISVTTGLSFVAMSATGIVLFVTPPGRIAHWTGWRMLALTKDQWGALHIWFSVIFMVAAVFHLYLNWRCFLSYFRGRVHRVFALRREWLVALLVCVIVGWGTLASVEPFSSLLRWNDAAQHSWETPASLAPVPHTELMTLSELADKTDGLPAESMIERLQAAGINVNSPNVVVGDLAKEAGMTPRQLYAIATGQMSRQRMGRGRGGFGGRNMQSGYGIGRLTLRQYCEQQSLDLEKTVQELCEKGFRPTPDMTLRDIAATGGVHPSAMRDILTR
jgi:hypothetical protein